MSGQLSFLTEEINKLQAKHAGRVRALKQHNAELSHAVELLQKREGLLKKDLALKNNEVDQLKSIAVVLEREVADANEEKQETATSLHTEVKRLKDALGHAEAAAKQSEERVAQLINQQERSSTRSKDALELAQAAAKQSEEQERIVAQLRGENVRLRQEQETARADAENSRIYQENEVNLWKEKYHSMEKDLEDIAAENSRLSRENNTLESKLDGMNKNGNPEDLLQAMEQELQNTKGMVDSQAQAVGRLQNEIASLGARNQEIEGALLEQKRSSMQKEQQLSMHLQTIQSKNSAMSQSLSKASEEAKGYKAEADKLRSETTSLWQQLQALEGKGPKDNSKELERLTQEHVERNSQLQGELSAAQQEKRVLEQRLLEAENSARGFLSENADMSERLASTLEEVGSYQRKLQDFEEHARSAQEELRQDFDRELKQLKDARSGDHSAKKELEQRLGDQENDLQQLAKENQELTRMYKEASKELERARSLEHTAHSSMSAQLDEERKRFEERLEKQKQLQTRATEEIEDLRNGRNQEQQDHRREMEMAMVENQTLRSQLETMEATVNRKRSEWEAWRSNAERDSANTIAELRGELDERLKDIGELRISSGDMEKAYSELETSFSKYKASAEEDRRVHTEREFQHCERIRLLEGEMQQKEIDRTNALAKENSRLCKELEKARLLIQNISLAVGAVHSGNSPHALEGNIMGKIAGTDAAFERQISDIAINMEKYKGKVTDLLNGLQSREDKIDALVRETAAARSLHENKEVMLSSELKKLQQFLSIAQKEEAKLREDLEIKGMDLIQANETVGKLKTSSSIEREGLRESLQSEIDEAKAKAADEERRAKVFEAQIFLLQEKQEEREDDINAMMNDERKKMNAMVTELVSASEKLQKRLQAMEIELDKKSNEVEEVKRAASDISEEKRSEIRKQVREDYSDLILKLTQQIERKEKSNKTLRSKVEALLTQEFRNAEECFEESKGIATAPPPTSPPPLDTKNSPMFKNLHVSTPANSRFIMDQAQRAGGALPFTPIQIQDVAHSMKSKFKDLAMKLAKEQRSRMQLELDVSTLSNLNNSHQHEISRAKDEFQRLSEKNEKLRKSNDDLKASSSRMSMGDFHERNEVSQAPPQAPPQEPPPEEFSQEAEGPTFGADTETDMQYDGQIKIRKPSVISIEDSNFEPSIRPPSPGMPPPPPPSPSAHQLQEDDELYNSLTNVIGSSPMPAPEPVANSPPGASVDANSPVNTVGHVESSVSPKIKSLLEFEVDWTPKSSRASSRSNSFSANADDGNQLAVPGRAASPADRSKASEDELLRDAAAKVVNDVKKSQPRSSVDSSHENWFVRNIVTPVAKTFAPSLSTEGKRGHMGKQNDFYFNKELNRWVTRGEEDLVVESVADEPPPTGDVEGLGLQPIQNDGRAAETGETPDAVGAGPPPPPTPSSARADFARGRMGSRYVQNVFAIAEPSPSDGANSTPVLSAPPSMRMFSPATSPRNSMMFNPGVFNPGASPGEGQKETTAAADQTEYPSQLVPLMFNPGSTPSASAASPIETIEEEPAADQEEESLPGKLAPTMFNPGAAPSDPVESSHDGITEAAAADYKAASLQPTAEASLPNPSIQLQQGDIDDSNVFGGESLADSNGKIQEVSKNQPRMAPQGSEAAQESAEPVPKVVDNSKQGKSEIKESEHLNAAPKNEPVFDFSAEVREKIVSNIARWKRDYKKGGSIPKKMKRFCKENKVSRTTAKKLLKTKDVLSLLAKEDTGTALDEPCVVEHSTKAVNAPVDEPETKVLNDSSFTETLTALAQDSIGQDVEESLNLQNGVGLDGTERNDLVDVYEDISLDDLGIVEPEGENGDDIGKGPVLEERDLVGNREAAGTNASIPAMDIMELDGAGESFSRDGADELQPIALNIPSVPELFDQIMTELELEGDLNVFDIDAESFVNPTVPVSPYVAAPSSFPMEMESIASENNEGAASECVDAMAKTVLRVLESNARNVMEFAGSVVDEVGSLEYSAPQWAEIDQKSSETEHNLTLALVCEKLRLANAVSNTEHTLDQPGSSQMVQLRFGPVLSATERAMEDFCAGVRTEFRRLVDEISESRAFIKQLEKLLGNEMEKKKSVQLDGTGGSRGESTALQEAERQLRLLEHRERSRMIELASMKRALNEQMEEVKRMVDQQDEEGNENTFN